MANYMILRYGRDYTYDICVHCLRLKAIHNVDYRLLTTFTECAIAQVQMSKYIP